LNPPPPVLTIRAAWKSFLLPSGRVRVPLTTSGAVHVPVDMRMMPRWLPKMNLASWTTVALVVVVDPRRRVPLLDRHAADVREPVGGEAEREVLDPANRRLVVAGRGSDGRGAARR
jgi:hypothetical protein